jgi:predicted nucleic-acid-binding protein
VTALDTNVLVRYLTRDDPAQFALAERLIDGAQEDGGRLFVTCIVACELVWVLRRGYRASRERTAEVLGRMLQAPVFAFERVDDVRGAHADYVRGPGDFADHLVRRIAASSGCQDVVTFDAALGKVPGFTLLA